ncbi:MAG TPA: AbrB/MazE/SpoVT family DNA-binding domain-containing protein [bacterium]|nr:AbrB/MazE/SpoVT family DNA-binding domain-containing protein [bacterium]
MPKVTVSPKYQVVIPREAREAMGIAPGEKLEVFQYGNRLEYVPVRRMRELRGFLKGLDPDVKRDKDRI